MVASKKFAIQMVCVLMCSERVKWKWLNGFVAKYFMGVGDLSLIVSVRVFANSHCVIVTHVNNHQFANFGHLSAISQNLSASDNLD